MSRRRRGEQHPFTPEPRIPEPWPDGFTPTGRIWGAEDGEPGESGGGHSTIPFIPGEKKRVEAFEAKQRKKWKRRGFSIGFGVYVEAKSGSDPTRYGGPNTRRTMKR